MNPLDLLRSQQAQNRANHAEAEKKREKKPQANDYNYVGGNADTGKAILQNGSGGVVSANAITNGLIKPNQSVKTSQAGSLITVDAMPRPKTKLKKLNPVSFGKIKILFSKVEGEQRVFYVGGDRLAPKRIHSLPKDASVSTAILHNLGDGDRFVVGLRWAPSIQTSAGTHTLSLGAQTWERTDAISNRAQYVGHGFWLGVGGGVTESSSDSEPTLRQLNTMLPGESSSMVRTFTYFSATETGGGSGTTDYFNGKSAGNDATATLTLSKSFSFSFTHRSLYRGTTQEFTGSTVHSASIDDFYFQPAIGSATTTSTAFSTFDQLGTVPILPNVTRPYTNSIRDPLFPYGENIPIVTTYSQPTPIVAGKNVSSAVYRLATYNNPDQYRCATSSADLVLGGDLPTFGNADNLIEQTLHSVQWSSLVLSQQTLLSVDSYVLSANTTKTSKQVSAFALKLDPKGLEKETELPINAANFTVHNASYHP